MRGYITSANGLKTRINSEYQLKGPICILHLLAFAAISLFSLKNFGNKKRGFGKVTKKVQNAGLSWKRSRNVGSGPPPRLDPVTSVVQASSYLSVCQPNSQGLNPYRKTGLILGS